MTIALNTASGGMDAFQQMLDVIGNNIANENTTAFKASSTQFADILSQTQNLGSAGSSTTGIGGVNPVQVGLGVRVAQINTDFSQGSMNNTGNQNNLMINGNGFFMVSSVTNPTSLSQIYFTRDGNFNVDSNGNLVTANGYYLLGSTNAITPQKITNSTTAISGLGTINVNNTNGQPMSFSVGPDGTVTVTNGKTSNYYIPVAVMENQNGLLKAGSDMFTSNGSGTSLVEGTITYDAGGSSSSGTGTVQQGFLESSNVDLTREMSNMIVAQTGYEANSKVINTVNQMNQFMIQQV